MSTYDYIFCPLCGGSKWLTDKHRSVVQGKLTVYRCSTCRKFSYSNISIPVDHPTLLNITQIVRYSIEATIEDYLIIVNYLENDTRFYKAENRKLILEVKQAVKFNWYKNEELVEKIKKYLVFS